MKVHFLNRYPFLNEFRSIIDYNGFSCYKGFELYLKNNYFIIKTKQKKTKTIVNYTNIYFAKWTPVNEDPFAKSSNKVN